jgi:hypothetical protein
MAAIDCMRHTAIRDCALSCTTPLVCLYGGKPKCGCPFESPILTTEGGAQNCRSVCGQVKGICLVCPTSSYGYQYGCTSSSPRAGCLCLTATVFEADAAPTVDPLGNKYISGTCQCPGSAYNSVNSAVTRAKVSRESACCAYAPLYATPIAEVCTNLITALAAFSLPAVRTSAPCYQDTAGADVLCDSTYQYNGPQATCSNKACSCPLNSVLGQPVQEIDSAGKQFTSVKWVRSGGGIYLSINGPPACTRKYTTTGFWHRCIMS